MQWKSKLTITLFLLICVQIVGICGFLSPLSEMFKQLSVFNLIFSVIILLINNENKSPKHWGYLLLVGVLGFFVEVIGVKTGFPFGTYKYGLTLGPKWLDVPLMMSLNWLIPVYCVGIIGNYTGKNIILKSLLGATLMLAMDILLEPIAIEFDYWSWSENTIPIRNYIAWFSISFLMLVGFHSIGYEKDNLVAPVLYTSQIILFCVLNLFVIKNTHSWYFIINILTVTFPLIRSFEYRVEFYKKWKNIALTTTILSIPFLIWDIWFTDQGYWGFTSNYLLGISFFGLPIEEILFFFTIPFACLFIYENVKFFFPEFNVARITNVGYLTLIIITLYVLVINPSGWYNILVCCGVLIWLTLNFIFATRDSFYWIFISYLFVIIPFTLMNGWLTGSYTELPIVWYDNVNNSGLRVMNIPVEDFIYCLLLIGPTINIYNAVGNRFFHK